MSEVTTCDWNDPVWLNLRQAEYDKRMAGCDIEPASALMFATHEEVVADIDLLPIEQGGRAILNR